MFSDALLYFSDLFLPLDVSLRFDLSTFFSFFAFYSFISLDFIFQKSSILLLKSSEPFSSSITIESIWFSSLVNSSISLNLSLTNSLNVFLYNYLYDHIYWLTLFHLGGMERV